MVKGRKVNYTPPETPFDARRRVANRFIKLRFIPTADAMQIVRNFSLEKARHLEQLKEEEFLEELDRARRQLDEKKKQKLDEAHQKHMEVAETTYPVRRVAAELIRMGIPSEEALRRARLAITSPQIERNAKTKKGAAMIAKSIKTALNLEKEKKGGK